LERIEVVVYEVSALGRDGKGGEFLFQHLRYDLTHSSSKS
jgi:hypothetical protein